MADRFTETSHTSFGGNIVRSIVGIPLGILLFLGSFAVLWMTEGRTDWSKVAIPETSGPPRQAAFLFVPGERGRGVLEEMIRNVRGADRGMLGPEGGTVLVDRGRMDFRGWDSDWIHMRTYEAGGTFRDAMRISLSTPDDPCVLTATWPRGVPASKAGLDELVSSFLAKPR